MEVVHGETKVGQDVFHGHAAILLQRGDGSADGRGVFGCERLIVDGSQRQFAIKGREHALQQAANGGQLIGGQTVEKRVGVVSLFA